MAVLQKIRKRQILLVSAIAAGLLFFILEAAMESLPSLLNQNKINVGEVNGEKLTTQEYQNLIDEIQTVYEIQGQSTTGEDALNRIKDEAWNNYIQTQLIKDECDKLGLAVSDEEVQDLLRSGASQMLQIPMFMNQQTGRYDYSIIQNFVTQYNEMKKSGQQMPDEVEKIYKYYAFAQRTLRQQALMNKYQTLLSNCFLSNPVEAKQTFDQESSTSDILLTTVPVSSIEDKMVEVNDQDIKAKYNENKEQYKQYVETRDIKYIDVPVKASKADIAQLEKEMQQSAEALRAAATDKDVELAIKNSETEFRYTNLLKTKNAFPMAIASRLDSVAVGTTTAPVFDAATNSYYAFRLVNRTQQVDSVLIRQIGVPGADEAAIAKTADSIYNAIQAGANFKEVAKKYNQTADSSWLSTASFENIPVDADNVTFINSIYDMQAGQVKKITLSNGATAIVKLEQAKHPITKYNVAAIVREVRFSEATYNETLTKLSTFLSEYKTVDDITANAEKNGFHFLDLNDITSNGHSIAGVHATRDAIKWLFEDAKPGQVSQLYECGDQDHFMVVALTGINKAGYRDYNKLKDIIKEEVLIDKKIAFISDKVKGVTSMADAQKVENAKTDTIRGISFNNPTFVPSTAASEPIISASASKTEKGKFVGPLKGNTGIYFFQVLNKNKKSDKYDAKTQQSTLANRNLQYAAGNVINVLYLNAKVKDQRYIYF